MNDRATHMQLCEQIADQEAERDEVRAILGKLTEADLDARIDYAQHTQERWQAAPFAVGATNHAHRYSACSSCGTGPCRAPEACEMAEPEDLAIWRGLGNALLAVAVMASIAIVLAAVTGRMA